MDIPFRHKILDTIDTMESNVDQTTMARLEHSHNSCKELLDCFGNPDSQNYINYKLLL